MPRTDLVCDASALIELLVGGDRAIAVAEAIEGTIPHAPHLALFEVVERIRAAERVSFLSSREAVTAVQDALELEIRYWAMHEFADRVWGLRHNVSAYDASYVALAEKLGAPLLTVDERLARASGPRCEFLVP